MSGIPAGSIIHVGGRTVINRLQDAGLQDPRVPTQTVYETGNDLVVGKVLTEADFRFQLTSWDVSCDLMALLQGKMATMGTQISAADAAGTVYRWENCTNINIMSPWKRDTGSAGGDISAGVIIPTLYPTIRLSVFFAVVGSLQLFDLVMPLTRGGPADSSNTLVTFLYNNGISRMRVGYGSAIGVILFAICVTFAFTYKRWFMRDE